MGFIGKTLDFFRSFGTAAENAFIRVKTNNPIDTNKMTYKLETVFKTANGLNIGGSAELEMKPGYLRIGVRANDTIIEPGKLSQLIFDGKSISISIGTPQGTTTSIIIDETVLSNLINLIGSSDEPIS